MALTPSHPGAIVGRRRVWSLRRLAGCSRCPNAVAAHDVRSEDVRCVTARPEEQAIGATLGVSEAAAGRAQIKRVQVSVETRDR